MATPLYGFLDLKHLWDQRVTEVGVSVVSEAIQQSVDEHNRQLAALIGLFAEPTTEFKVNFKTATVSRNQPLDDNGRARPILPSGYYEVAFPLQASGNAWGANYRARQKLTVEEANNITSTLIDGDTRWVRDHILAALFASTAWTFNDEDEGHGNLTIKGLANGDTDTYQVAVGADAGSTDTHYSAQAAAIDDSNDPFETYIYDELVEHPENMGECVAFVPTNLKSAVEGLAGYYPANDKNIAYGSGVSTVMSELGVDVPGELFGYHESGVFLVHWRSMPSNYIVGTMTEGERALRMRQDAEADLQGFKQQAVREDHPFWEAQYVRYAGFGAWNRVGAVVHRIGNAAYAEPTNYGSPMA